MSGRAQPATHTHTNALDARTETINHDDGARAKVEYLVSSVRSQGTEEYQTNAQHTRLNCPVCLNFVI